MKRILSATGTARDMARFGLLFLRKGKLAREAAYSEKVGRGEHDCLFGDRRRCRIWDSGYGYLWWVAVNGNHIPHVDLPDGSFSARGSGGHFIVVIPSLDLVIVHRVNTDVDGMSVSPDQFGRLLELILEARNRGVHKADAH